MVSVRYLLNQLMFFDKTCTEALLGVGGGGGENILEIGGSDFF